jgi:hypothetical protein
MIMCSVVYLHYSHRKLQFFATYSQTFYFVKSRYVQIEVPDSGQLNLINILLFVHKHFRQSWTYTEGTKVSMQGYMSGK